MKITVTHIREQASFEIKVDDFSTVITRQKVMTDKDYHIKAAQDILFQLSSEQIPVLANKIKEEISKH